jgi:tetratricopeptide (TPR) repeat protein
MHRTRYSLGGVLVFSLLLLTLGLAVYVTLNLEPVRRRLDALPYYARTYVNKVLPKPVLPTPPAVSEIDAQTLLEARTGVNSQSASESTQIAPGETGLPGSDQPNDSTDQAQTSGPAGVRLVTSNVTDISPIAPSVTLAGFTHEWQTWNNCGPATISMNLSYYGQGDTQVEAARFLKPNPDDKNVNPDELLAYARSVGYDGVVGYGGDIDLLKHLLSNGFPVMVETWAKPEDQGGMGHYRLLIGYSQAENRFLTYDSLHGPGVIIPIEEFDRFWRVFNRTYLVVFPPEQAPVVYAILGPRADKTAMTEKALLAAQEEARANPGDPFAWFNVGTDYARLGEAGLAASAFDEARRLGLPYRMLWYQFDIFQSYLATGRHQEVIDLATATLKASGGLEELYYARGLALAALNQPGAAGDFQAALDYNPNFEPAAKALEELR